MNIATHAFNRIENALFELFIVSFIYFLAIATLILMMGEMFQLRFSTTAPYIAAAAILSLLVTTYHKRAAFSQIQSQPKVLATAVCVLLLAVSAGLISASINRPDIDDSEYVSKAVFYTEHPNAVLDKSEYWIGGIPKESQSLIFHYFETIQASLSWLTDVHFLNFYHVLFPATVEFLFILSIYQVLSIFEQRKSVLIWGIVFTLFLLLLLGETHRTYGNLTIARAFHGKFVLISVGSFTWLYFSIKYFVTRHLESLAMLTAVGVAMAGATTTTYVFIPFFSLIIFMSYLISQRKIPGKNELLVGIKYFCALIPVLMAAIQFRSIALTKLSPDSHYNAYFSNDFIGQLNYLINPDYPLTPILFVVAALVVFYKSPYRLFFQAWIVLCGILLLNPWVSGFVIKNITTQNIYWRMFYLLPFPFIVIYAFTLLIDEGMRSKLFASTVLTCTVFFSLWGPTTVIREQNQATLEFPGFKINRSLQTFLPKVIDATAPGSMFAPVEVSSNILLLTSKYPQFYIREDDLELSLNNVGMHTEFLDRSKASQYLYDDNPAQEGHFDFLKILEEKDKPKYFILKKSSANLEAIVRDMVGHGYEEVCQIDSDYLLFTDTLS